MLSRVTRYQNRWATSRGKIMWIKRRTLLFSVSRVIASYRECDAKRRATEIQIAADTSDKYTLRRAVLLMQLSGAATQSGAESFPSHRSCSDVRFFVSTKVALSLIITARTGSGAIRKITSTPRGTSLSISSCPSCVHPISRYLNRAQKFYRHVRPAIIKVIRIYLNRMRRVQEALRGGIAKTRHANRLK